MSEIRDKFIILYQFFIGESVPDFLFSCYFKLNENLETIEDTILSGTKFYIDSVVDDQNIIGCETLSDSYRGRLNIRTPIIILKYFDKEDEIRYINCDEQDLYNIFKVSSFKKINKETPK